MVIKLVLGVTTAVVLLLSISTLTSYSRAEIGNDVSLRIVDTNEALIAVNDFTGWEPVANNTAPSKNQKFFGTLQMTNNTSEAVEVLDVNAHYVGSVYITSEKIILYPGMQGEIPIYIEIDPGTTAEQRLTKQYIDIDIVVKSFSNFNTTIRHHIPSISQNPPGNLYDNKSIIEETNEITDEAESEIADEVENEITDEVESEIADEVENEIADEVVREIADEVENEITDEVESEIADKVENEEDIENNLSTVIEEDKTN